MSYREYLASEAWKAKRDEYKRSDMPQSCLGCGVGWYQLHHITYQRLGCELLGDLVPLCTACHEAVHRYLSRHTTNLNAMGRIGMNVFGWTKQQAREKMARFNEGGLLKEVAWNHPSLTDRQKRRQRDRLFPPTPKPERKYPLCHTTVRRRAKRLSPHGASHAQSPDRT